VTVSLLDINILLALMDSDHVQHDLVLDWFDSVADDGWASCAITENGFVRIISQPGYANPITTSDALARISSATSDPSHHFWKCGVSLANPKAADPTKLFGPGQVTDAYLLALAVHHKGRFVTLDRRVNTDAVRNATAKSLLVLSA
jgi:toxin-antitoxin system PIN domain toxin